MILESMIETVVIIVLISLFILFLFIRTFRRRKIHKLVDKQEFINNFFIDHAELRDEEFIPMRAKPINRLKNDIFMANTFCLFLTGLKVVRIYYDEIYWTYGEVKKAPKNGKQKFKNIEVVVLKTLSGTYRVYVPSQSPYIDYLFNLGIPAGYTERVKKIALDRKEQLKALKRKNKR